MTHSGYRANEFLPRIHRSDDGGNSWVDISSNLPDIAINDVYIIPNRDDEVLFVATDGGVYGTVDGGGNWDRLGTNMPIIPVHDLEFNVEKLELVAGTYARSIQSYDLQAILDETSSTVENEPFDLKTSLKVFPNPTADFINVEFYNSENGKNGHLVILDAQGKVITQEILSDFGKNSLQIDVSNFPAGHYFAKLKIRHRVETVKFSKL